MTGKFFKGSTIYDLFFLLSNNPVLDTCLRETKKKQFMPIFHSGNPLKMWKNEKKLLEIDCKDAHRCGNLGSFICLKSSMTRTQNKSYSNDIFLLMAKCHFVPLHFNHRCQHWRLHLKSHQSTKISQGALQTRCLYKMYNHSKYSLKVKR